jgi:hypothetical protein
MNFSSKNILIGILIFIVAILTVKLFISDILKKKDNSSVDSTIVVQRIQKVLKLITVEGNFSELMKYNDFDYVDLPGFRKDALVRINAKVSIGYNLDSLKITSNEKEKTIVIQHMPKPQILSIDSDIKYENISEGLFTSFNEQELSKLNKIAKEKIRQQALSPELIKQAEEQKNDLLEMLFYMAKENGYKIMIEGNELKGIVRKE